MEELGNREKEGFVSSNFKYKWNRNIEEDYYDYESVVTNKGHITDDSDEEGDEPTAISINEFHDIADDVNEMVADEQVDDSDIIHNGISHEDKRSERDTSSDGDSNMRQMSLMINRNHQRNLVGMVNVTVGQNMMRTKVKKTLWEQTVLTRDTI